MQKNTRLKNLVYQKAESKGLLADPRYKKRLDLELSIIKVHECADFFLTYARIMDICKAHGIICSPGRAFAVGSLVNYCLSITGLDPIKYELFHEPFLVRHSTNFMDITIEIPLQRYDQLLDAIKSEMPSYNVYRVANPHIIQEGQGPDSFEIDMKMQVHKSQLYISKTVNENRLLKMDSEVLYFRDPDEIPTELNLFNIWPHPSMEVIDSILELIGPKYSPAHIPMDDPDTLATFWEGDFAYIPFPVVDLKSIRSFAKQLKPEQIEDIAILYVLYDEYFSDSLDDILAYKTDPGKNSYSDKRLDEILRGTYGQLFYIETIYQILLELGGIRHVDIAWAIERLRQEPGNEVITREYEQSWTDGLLANSRLTDAEIHDIVFRILNCVPEAHLKCHLLSLAHLTYWMVYYKVHFRAVYDIVRKQYLASL